MSTHLSAEQFVQYLGGGLPVEQLLAVDAHLVACQSCQDQLQITQRLATGVASLRADFSQATDDSFTHLTWEQMADLADQKLAAVALENAESHLQDCPACATELAELCTFSGRRIPGDVALLGCNNDQTEIRSSALEVSSIDLNTEQIGFEAVRVLLPWLATGKKPAPLTLLRPLKIVTRRSTERFAATDPAVQLALEYIHERLAGTFGVTDVAKVAGVSRRVLELRFRRDLGFSVYAEVQRLRLERAQALIVNPELRLVDVAREAGFSSGAKLSTAFKAHHRISPKHYRSHHLGPRA